MSYLRFFQYVCMCVCVCVCVCVCAFVHYMVCFVFSMFCLVVVLVWLTDWKDSFPK